MTDADFTALQQRIAQLEEQILECLTLVRSLTGVMESLQQRIASLEDKASLLEREGVLLSNDEFKRYKDMWNRLLILDQKYRDFLAKLLRSLREKHVDPLE